MPIEHDTRGPVLCEVHCTATISVATTLAVLVVSLPLDPVPDGLLESVQVIGVIVTVLVVVCAMTTLNDAVLLISPTTMRF